MSCTFNVGDLTVWNPSNTVARLFKEEAEAIAATFDIPSGLGPIIEDECEIDVVVFEAFVGQLIKQYEQVVHPIFKTLTVGFIATASVLVERAGGQLPPLPAAQTNAWAQLRAEHARSMSR
jgi:hypothetical protein